MANYAYLRVSKDEQDINNQKHGILEYANKNSITDLIFIEDKVSSRIAWDKRKIGELITHTATQGDTVIFAEVSRMARSVLEVLDILKISMERELKIYISKQNLSLDNSLQAKIYATVLGLAAEIEREFISARTKEALAKLKAEGKTLGRPKGSIGKSLKLDKHKKEIIELINKNVSVASISKIFDANYQTMTRYIGKLKTAHRTHPDELRNLEMKLTIKKEEKCKN